VDVLGSAMTSDQPETLVFTAPAAAVYYLMVMDFDYGDTAYVLTAAAVVE